MKTAVLITGKLDYFKETYNNISDRLLSFLGDYDVFISTWDLSEQDKTDLISLYNPKILDTEVFNENTKYLIHNHFNYQKALDIEPKYGTRNSLYMWYKVNKGLNLIKEYSLFNDVKYDYVVRLRTDFFFTNYFDPTFLNEDIIIGPHLDHFSHLGAPHASDNFFITPISQLDNLAQLYFKYSDLWDSGNYISPEHLYYDYLKDLNISFNKSNLKFGRTYENVCILWAPSGEAFKGYGIDWVLNIKEEFEVDNNSQLNLIV